MHRTYTIDTDEKWYLSLGDAAKLCVTDVVSAEVCIIRYIVVINSSHLCIAKWHVIKELVFT